MTSLQEALAGAKLTTEGANQEGGNDREPAAPTSKAATPAKARKRATVTTIRTGGSGSNPRNVVHHVWLNSLWAAAVSIYRAVISGDYRSIPNNVDVYALLPVTGGLRNPEGIMPVAFIPATFTQRGVVKVGRHIYRDPENAPEKGVKRTTGDRHKVGFNVQKFDSMGAGKPRSVSDLLEAALLTCATVAHVEKDGQLGRSKGWQGTVGALGYRPTESATGSKSWANPVFHAGSEAGRKVKSLITSAVESLGPIPEDLMVDYLNAASRDGRVSQNEYRSTAKACKSADCAFLKPVRYSKRQAEAMAEAKVAPACPIHKAALTLTKAATKTADAKRKAS